MIANFRNWLIYNFRLQLIWDGVAAVPDALEISPELKAELDARLEEFEANPKLVIPMIRLSHALKMTHGVPPEIYATSVA